MPCLETQFRIFISKIAFSVCVCVGGWVGKIPVLYTNIHRKTLSVSRTSIIVILTTVKKSSMKFQISNSKKKQSTLLTLPHHCPNPSFLHQGSLSKEWKKVTNININHVCGWVDGWMGVYYI